VQTGSITSHGEHVMNQESCGWPWSGHSGKRLFGRNKMLHDSFVPELIPVQLCPLTINHENARVTEESVMHDAQIGVRAKVQRICRLNTAREWACM
jgi:hypothetical protein